MKAFVIAFVSVVVGFLINAAESKILDKAEIDRLYPTNQGAILEINVNGSNFESIEVSAFDSFTSVIYINLQNNLITKLVTNQFHLNVEIINLSGNRISTIEAGAFKTPFLRKLELDRNELTTFSSDAISGKKGLYHLDLSSNKLSSLPTDTFNAFDSLNLLYLDNNRINELSDEFLKSSTNLTFLGLSGNDIKKVNLDLVNNIIRTNSRCFAPNLHGNPIGSEMIIQYPKINTKDSNLSCPEAICKKTNKSSGYCTSNSAVSSGHLGAARFIWILVSLIGSRFIYL